LLFEKVIAATGVKAKLFFLSCAVSFGADSFFFLNVTNFFIPIAIDTMPSRPIIYVGMTNNINEPNVLLETSKPIPIYCPNITCRSGKVNEEKTL
jgi:hypothetical protein